jgi:glycosyltransferase involved in cell wall biosynthesis
MVEALASGKPVIALGQGGAREIVPEDGGVLYENATIADLDAALSKFDDGEHRVRPDQLQWHSQRFSETRFVEEMWGVLAECVTQNNEAKILRSSALS